MRLVDYILFRGHPIDTHSVVG